MVLPVCFVMGGLGMREGVAAYWTGSALLSIRWELGRSWLVKRPLFAHERFLLSILPGNYGAPELCNYVVVKSMCLRIAEMLGVPLRGLSDSVKEEVRKALREGKSFKAIYEAAKKRACAGGGEGDEAGFIRYTL